MHKGIIHITGEHDTGKTLMALQACHPRDTIFFHDDVKQPDISPKEFKQYHDLVQECQDMTLFPFREHVIKLIADIPECGSIVFDTWTRFATASRNYAVKNPDQFIKKSEMVMTHDLKVLGAQRWRAAHDYEAKIISVLSHKAPLVILVTHLKDEIRGNAKTGKQIADAGKSLDRVCNFRVWLRHNQNSGVPIALVLKRLALPTVSKNGVGMINILPRRIKPLQNESSVWQAIERYKNNPVGNRQPTKDEMPTPFELSILDGILTPDQKEVWQANLRAQQMELINIQDNAKIRAQELMAAGKNIIEISQVIDMEYPGMGYNDIGKVGGLLT
jgi:hypothetical protein